jgi:hypothetical protein
MTGTDATTARCKGCGRVLRAASSVARGYGRVCAKREAAKTAEFSIDQVVAARQILADGGVTRTARDLSGPLFLVSTSPYTKYWTSPTECSCIRGQRGELCKHLAAVRISLAA